MRNVLSILFISISSIVLAQDPCDDLNFLSIQYSPFTDSVVVISVENNSSQLFDYPGFVLINSDGDTVAKEMVNYFGIGSQSVHTLEVYGGMQDPLQNFQGQLQLHTLFYDELACSWNLDQSLCASEPCDSLIIGFENWGGALVLGDFAWSVLDSNDVVIESGTLTMDPELQYWQRGFCVSPGAYSYTLSALGEPSGGGPTMTVSASSWFSWAGSSQPFNWEEPNVMEVPFYLQCIDSESPSGTTFSSDEAELLVLRQADQLTLRSSQNIREVELISMDGKSMGTFVCNSTEFHLPTLPEGIYMVKVLTDERTFVRSIPVIR